MIFAPLVATVSILIGFVIAQAVIDSIRGRRFKRVSNRLLEIGKRQSLTTVSVIIRANGSKQQVTDLLDHLGSFKYDKLQIVVIPRSQKNKRGNGYLTEYRSSRPDMNIRLVRSGGRRDDKAIATRHARGELIVWMNLTERLSPRFFELVSYEFADDVVRRIDVPYRYQTARTISELLAAWSIVRSETLDLMRRNHRRERRVVYRRAAFKQGAVPTRYTSPGTQLACIRPHPVLDLRSTIVLFSNVLATLLVGYAALYYLSTEWFFTVLALVAAYLLANVFWLMSSKRHTTKESIPLILVLPFAILGSLSKRN